MPQIIVQHKVSDYDKWERSFQDSDIIRKMFGEQNYTIFRNSEEPNDVVILFEWKDTKKAIKYASSAELGRIMKLAGVLGTPAIYITGEELDS